MQLILFHKCNSNLGKSNSRSITLPQSAFLSLNNIFFASCNLYVPISCKCCNNNNRIQFASPSICFIHLSCSLLQKESKLEKKNILCPTSKCIFVTCEESKGCQVQKESGVCITDHHICLSEISKSHKLKGSTNQTTKQKGPI